MEKDKEEKEREYGDTLKILREIKKMRKKEVNNKGSYKKNRTRGGRSSYSQKLKSEKTVKSGQNSQKREVVMFVLVAILRQTKNRKRTFLKERKS